ncbi:hypothetical protein J6590_033496 [Homalodisca vitripennis]|nr:hypothetical protein J6590_033496 [Homalodisca vitripennis]
MSRNIDFAISPILLIRGGHGLYVAYEGCAIGYRLLPLHENGTRLSDSRCGVYAVISGLIICGPQLRGQTRWTYRIKHTHRVVVSPRKTRVKKQSTCTTRYKYVYYSLQVCVLLAASTCTTRCKYVYYSLQVRVLLAASTCTTRCKYVYYSLQERVLLAASTCTTRCKYVYYSLQVRVLLASNTVLIAGRK